MESMKRRMKTGVNIVVEAAPAATGGPAGTQTGFSAPTECHLTRVRGVANYVPMIAFVEWPVDSA